VYSFFDVRGKLIYIAQRMAPGIDRAEFRETPFELLALLLGDHLIKRRNPMHTSDSRSTNATSTF
jgi:hypothetical protein